MNCVRIVISSRRSFSRLLSSNSIGLFESEKDQNTYSRKDHGDLSIPGTLDAELDRLGVHLGRSGEPYVSSHDLDRTGLRFYPEARNEGFPPGRLKMTQKQRERLAEVLIADEARKKRSTLPSIFHWEVQYVISKGDFEDERNRFVKMFVFLKELQRRYNLTDNAIQYIIKLAAHRYNSNTGLLTLQSGKYANREDNRREIMRMVNELVAEGHRKFPAIKLHKTGSYISRRYPRRSSPVSQWPSPDHIEEFFNMVDSDGDRSISLEDLQVFFAKAGVKVKASVLEELMLFKGTDSNGQLSLEDFTAILSAACTPDIRPGRKTEGKYKLKEKTMMFDFKTKSVSEKDELDRQVA